MALRFMQSAALPAGATMADASGRGFLSRDDHEVCPHHTAQHPQPTRREGPCGVLINAPHRYARRAMRQDADDEACDGSGSDRGVAVHCCCHGHCPAAACVVKGKVLSTAPSLRRSRNRTIAARRQ